MGQASTGASGAGVHFCPSCGAQQLGAAVQCQRCGASLAPGGGRPRSKLAAALLAFFLGGLGVHKFYLGKTAWGVVYLLFCWTLIPRLVSFVEFIILLVQSDEEFRRRYPGPAPGPAFIAVAGLAVVLVGVAMLAAIAIPNFLRYQLRSKSQQTQQELVALMQAEVRAAKGGELVGFAPLPASPPGTERRPLAPEEQALAARLGWDLSQTYGQFRVAVVKDGTLRGASFCAEDDLDGDGRHAAVIGFLAVADADGKVALPPPPAPCSEAADIGPDGTAFRPEWNNRYVRVSPPDVF